MNYPAKAIERLHPQSWKELRQLVKLHGAQAIIRAVRHIAAEWKARPDEDHE
jgi:hypothetical protein